MGVYDFKPRGSGSGDAYLRLKQKGDKVKFRITGEPYYELKVWSENENKFVDADKVQNMSNEQMDEVIKDPDYSVSETFSWVVIHRMPVGDGEVEDVPKIYTGSKVVFSKIGAYANDEDWGDPTAYDITVERTEEPGSAYYSVTPSPNKKKLTADEKKLAESLDVSKLLPNARPLAEVLAERKVSGEIPF